jgi:hypothetical protein
MATVRLPRVAVSRELASSLIAQAAIRTNEEVEVNGRGLVVNNESFAYQLAEDLSKVRPLRVRVIGGSPKWHANFKKASKKFQLDVVDVSNSAA